MKKLAARYSHLSGALFYSEKLLSKAKVDWYLHSAREGLTVPAQHAIDFHSNTTDEMDRQSVNNEIPANHPTS